MIVFADGRFVDAVDVLSADDRGFLLGDAVFETILMQDGRPAFLDAHLERLRRGLDVMRMPAPATLGETRARLAELAARNGCASGSAAARLTVSRGPGGRGLAPPARLAPTFVASVSPYTAPRGPARLVVTDRRVWSGAATHAFKAAGAYAEFILARIDAAEAGADEGLLRNEHGVIVGAAAANLFMVTAQGVLRTPSRAEGARDGVVRRIVLEEARAAGVPVREGALAPEDLAGALLFLTNSLIGLLKAVTSPEAPDLTTDVFRVIEARYKGRFEREWAEGRS